MATPDEQRKRRRRGAFGCILGKVAPFTVRWREQSVTFTADGTPTEKVVHKRKSGFKTRTEAAEELARQRLALRQKTPEERWRDEEERKRVAEEKRRAAISFDDVAQEWLRLHSAATLRSHPLNLMNYRVHVAPFFGKCPLAAVDAKRILELRAHLQVKAKLAPRTVNLQLALVRAILKFAVANGHLASAPTDRLKGKGKLMLPVEKAKLAPPIERPEQVGRLLEAIREQRPDRYALFATLVYTGMRKGEVCGLHWSDVDFDRRVVTIRRSYGGLTKSGAHRDVPLPSPLVVILEAHKLAEPYRGALVFPNDQGEMYTKNGKLEDVLRPALATVGLKQIRLHDLRHVHAAHFLMAGGSLYDLQQNLGHHSVAFTASVYGHLSQDHRVKESDRLAGLFVAPEPAKVLAFAQTAK
jgi:integrase